MFERRNKIATLFVLAGAIGPFGKSLNAQGIAIPPGPQNGLPSTPPTCQTCEYAAPGFPQAPSDPFAVLVAMIKVATDDFSKESIAAQQTEGERRELENAALETGLDENQMAIDSFRKTIKKTEIARIIAKQNPDYTEDKPVAHPDELTARRKTQTRDLLIIYETASSTVPEIKAAAVNLVFKEAILNLSNALVVDFIKYHEARKEIAISELRKMPEPETVRTFIPLRTI